MGNKHSWLPTALSREATRSLQRAIADKIASADCIYFFATTDSIQGKQTWAPDWRADMPHYLSSQHGIDPSSVVQYELSDGTEIVLVPEAELIKSGLPMLKWPERAKITTNTGRGQGRSDI